MLLLPVHGAYGAGDRAELNGQRAPVSIRAVFGLAATFGGQEVEWVHDGLWGLKLVDSTLATSYPSQVLTVGPRRRRRPG